MLGDSTFPLPFLLIWCVLSQKFDIFLLLYFQSDAEKMYSFIKTTAIDPSRKPSFIRCGLCGATTNTFKILSSELESVDGKTHSADLHFNASDKVTIFHMNWIN